MWLPGICDVVVAVVGKAVGLHSYNHEYIDNECDI